MSQAGPVVSPKNSARHTIFGVPEGYDSLFLARLAEKSEVIIHIAADDLRFEQMDEALRFFAPQIEVLRFPAWDCLPYDRISPTSSIVGERLKTLSILLNSPLPLGEGQGEGSPRNKIVPSPQSSPKGRGRIILTTISAIIQRLPARELLKHAVFHVATGGRLDMQKLQSFLAANGYHRTDTVREPGEFALRGGLIDIFPAGAPDPLRLDLFGDEVEKIRAFDALSQRTTEDRKELSLYPAAEVLLTPEAIENFRSKYREIFGTVRKDDALYESISEARVYAGMEHWLPLYYDHLDTLFDYAPGATVTFDHQAEQARDMRFAQVIDLYQARLTMLAAEKTQKTAQYRPVPVEQLYLPDIEWRKRLEDHSIIDLSPFAAPPGQEDGGGRKGRDFGDIRAQSGVDLYAAVHDHIKALQKSGKKTLLVAYSAGSRDRLAHLLKEQNLHLSSPPTCSGVQKAVRPSHESLQDAQTRFWMPEQVRHDAGVYIDILGLERGFESQDLAVLTEQDMLGDRLSRIGKKKKKSDAFLFEISQLHEGDFVVHEDHGVGQFEKLETVVVDNIPHDCLKLIYAGGDKLFVPVENLDVLTRYGSAEGGAVLDKLGGAAWQARKARIKRDLLALANELLKIAAARILRESPPIQLDNITYEKFCSGFPYPETEDQQKAIEDVLEDLNDDKAMDRLVCGDVGFGKTEVALRATAAATLTGHQVALIAPTTLLARQHYQTFMKRFHGFPVRIGLLSRFVSAKEAEQTKELMAKGEMDIIIGTHALLSENIKFHNLALLIVDEEQKFGVKQKERLKQLKENVHVLTLTATPIPRTLQMALSGVREMSLITTAPVDRLAVKTFVLPYDPVIIREALMREHYRGGQTFYVCPRISDLRELEENLKLLVPELKIVVAHGQMGAEEVEEKISAFYEGAFDILLSTTIVESGLDIPNANTMVIHRAEMFGLAQLYQLRGRIGRAKQRAYAYMTYEPQKRLTKAAGQRLHAIEQLDTLGAGFQLASHDLDIRGAGNLLGEEQSGHIREVGVELYQQMLEEAVAAARDGGKLDQIGNHWSPHINLGIPVMIPDSYIPDLNLRLSIYRRIAELADKNEIENTAAELIDRFGPLPDDVENLLKLVAIKQLCRMAGVAKIDAGPKGALVSFHPSTKIDIAKLMKYIGQHPATVKLRPEDQKLVYIKAWDEIDARLRGTQKILQELSALL